MSHEHYHEYRGPGGFSTGFGLSCGCLCGIAAFILVPIVLVVIFLAGGQGLRDELKKPPPEPTGQRP